MNKFCNRCSELKPLAQFKDSSSYRDGKHCWCIACKKEYDSVYYQKNKKEMSAMSSEWRRKNPERAKEIYAKYRKSEKRAVVIKRWKEKKKNDVAYRLSNSVGCSMRDALLGRKKGVSWTTIAGYTVDDLKNHLESQFKQGMSWNNYGKWQIDHIRPICSFNFNSIDDEEFKKCWALENLQPLWAEENSSKGGRWQPTG